MEAIINDRINNLFKIAESNNENLDIDSAIGEVTINNIEYQIQISLIANKKRWCKEDEVRYSEVVKFH